MSKDLPIDLAHPDYRLFWLSHPILGDASFDAFERIPANPICVGSPPFEWPVNGFLFQDPVGSGLYAYIGEYPQGYWPPGGCHLLRSMDSGTTWEDMGTVLHGDALSLDGDGIKPGGTPDVSVVYADGLYHMVYDWGNPDNSDGGIAYAWSERPEGPFQRAEHPIHSESGQPFLLAKYKRVYAATLIRRAKDWLIVADMSTPGNAGGTWAMVAFTSPRPEGPYEGPTLLLWPQSTSFLPAPVEAFPTFVHEDYVYAPATSVALNRGFQVIYRAKLEEAHRPAAWKIYQYGSVWHAEASPHEATGIWGQTWSGLVDAQGELWALYPSKTVEDVGTINLAHRAWRQPYKPGLVISAPNGPGLSLLLRDYVNMTLEAHVRATGPKHLIWNHNAPLGCDRPPGAGAEPDTLCFVDCMELSLDSAGWSVQAVAADGDVATLGSGLSPASAGMSTDVIVLEQRAGQARVTVNEREVWQGPVGTPSGSIGFIADAGSIVYVDRLMVSQGGESCCKFLLPTEAIMGSGASPTVWDHQTAPSYRYGMGFASQQGEAMAKWNYRGRGFRLWSPRGPSLGVCSLYIDGQHVQDIALHAPVEEPSAPLFVRTELPFGFHAVSLVQKEGTIVCDCLEIAL